MGRRPRDPRGRRHDPLGHGDRRPRTARGGAPAPLRRSDPRAGRAPRLLPAPLPPVEPRVRGPALVRAAHAVPPRRSGPGSASRRPTRRPRAASGRERRRRAGPRATSTRSSPVCGRSDRPLASGDGGPSSGRRSVVLAPCRSAARARRGPQPAPPGIAGTLSEHLDAYDLVRFWVVVHQGAPVAAALRTEPTTSSSRTRLRDRRWMRCSKRHRGRRGTSRRRWEPSAHRRPRPSSRLRPGGSPRSRSRKACTS